MTDRAHALQLARVRASLLCQPPRVVRAPYVSPYGKR
jgi:hypothetical protein